jgi:hypothetical protein
MKIRNQQWPKLPRSVILKTQECPCFRNGCLCNFSELHPFREGLLVPPGKPEVLKNLEETRQVWQTIKEESEKTLADLKRNIMKLHMATTEATQAKQLDTKVIVGNETITAIVDSGADVDYIKKEWCEEKKFIVNDLGEGWMEGFDAKQTRTTIQEAEVEFEFDKEIQQRKFRVITETGTDLMVLGMPWLRDTNPEIDWQKRTVTLRKTASRNERGSETPTSRTKHTEAEQQPKRDNSRRKRGGYGGD